MDLLWYTELLKVREKYPFPIYFKQASGTRPGHVPRESFQHIDFLQEFPA